MADINELYGLLQQADAAAQSGDTQAIADVQALLGEIDRLNAQQAATQPSAPTGAPAVVLGDNPQVIQDPLGNEPSMAEQALSAAAPVIRGAGPPLANVALGAGAGLVAGGVMGAPVVGARVGATLGSVVNAIGDPLVLGVNALLGTRITTPTEAWTSIIDQAGIRPNSDEYDMLLESLSRGGANALTTVGAGAILQGMTSPMLKSIGTALASQPLQQVAASALSDVGAVAGSEIAEELGYEGAGQVVGGLAGGIAGGVVGSRMAAPRVRPTLRVPGMDDAAIRETVEEATKAGRSVLTADVLPPKTAIGRRLQDFREGTWLGVGSIREAQQLEDRLGYVTEVLDTYGAGADKELAGSIVQNLNKTRSDRIDHWSGWKNNVLDRVSSVISPLKETDLPKTFTTIQSEINDLKRINNPVYAPIIAKLEDFKLGLLGEPILDPVSGSVVGYAGKSLKDLEKNLEVIKPLLAKDSSLASISTPTNKIGNKIYGAISEDIKDTIRKADGQSSVDSYRIAKAKLNEGIKDLKSDTLRAIFRKGDVTPEIVNRLLISNSSSELKLLLANLDPIGRANAKAAFLSWAAQQATNPVTGEISPEAFAKALGQKAKQVGIIFKGSDLKVVNGLSRYLNLTRRAEKLNIDPPTGNRLVLPYGLSLLVDAAGKAGTVATLGMGGLLSRVYESTTVRNLLMKLPLINNSNEQIAAIKRISEAIAAESSNYERERLRNVPLTFIGENTVSEPLGNGYITTDNKTGYRIVSRDGNKFKLYAPDNKRIGIFDDFEHARNRAELEVRKRK